MDVVELGAAWVLVAARVGRTGAGGGEEEAVGFGGVG